MCYYYKDSRSRKNGKYVSVARSVEFIFQENQEIQTDDSKQNIAKPDQGHQEVDSEVDETDIQEEEEEVEEEGTDSKDTTNNDDDIDSEEKDNDPQTVSQSPTVDEIKVDGENSEHSFDKKESADTAEPTGTEEDTEADTENIDEKKVSKSSEEDDEGLDNMDYKEDRDSDFVEEIPEKDTGDKEMDPSIVPTNTKQPTEDAVSGEKGIEENSDLAKGKEPDEVESEGSLFGNMFNGKYILEIYIEKL